MSLFGNRMVRVSGGIILAIAAVALLGPWLSPNDYLSTNFDRLLSPPSLDGASFFGTDDLGRDLFVRTMLGIRVTLMVAIVASLVSLVIGVAWGATAGYCQVTWECGDFDDLNAPNQTCAESGKPDSEKAEDVVIANFEGEDYGDWTVEGSAFGSGPSKGSLEEQPTVFGYQGEGLANSFVGGDGLALLMRSSRPLCSTERPMPWRCSGGVASRSFRRKRSEGKPPKD